MKFLAALATTAFAANLYESDFVAYVAKFNKSYGTHAEFKFRLEQYIATELRIQEFNNREGMTSTVAHNIFSDMTVEEKRRMGNDRNQVSTVSEEDVHILDGEISNGAFVDWRTQGVLNPI